MKIKVKVIKNGILPSKAYKNDAGFDVYSTGDYLIKSGEITSIPLNIKMELPEDSFVTFESKSGLGKRGMFCFANVIDSGYRGIPHVTCTNLSNTPILIKTGNKLCL